MNRVFARALSKTSASGGLYFSLRTICQALMLKIDLSIAVILKWSHDEQVVIRDEPREPAPESDFVLAPGRG